jgi:hypothetical protein
MDLFAPLRRGAGLTQTLAGGALKLTAATPRLVVTLVRRGPVVAAEETLGVVEDAVVRAAPGARDAQDDARAAAEELRRRPPADATGDAAARQGDVPAARPEPTSAAGASGGVGGTFDAPGDAGAVGAPDPTAVDLATGATGVTQGERGFNDMGAPTRAADQGFADDEVVHSFGDPEDPSASVVVQEPWEGYDRMTANEIVARLREADASTRGVVALYEQARKGRKRVLEVARA